MVEQQREREDKYDVGPGWALPDLTDLLPTGGRFEIAEFAIDNTYFDTPSGHLTQLGVTLRRREGGPDAGWHLKVPQGGARNEITDATDSSTLPVELARIVTGLRAGEELKPIAKLTVSRTVHRLVTEEGALAAELADDLVHAATMGEESRLTTWREIEVELKPAGDERLLTVIGKRLRQAGAKRFGFASKLRRALGTELRNRYRAYAAGTTRRPRRADYLSRAGARRSSAATCSVRLGEPEVHKFRVAIRRTRSHAARLRVTLRAGTSGRARAELVWLAGLLGEVRDRDILRARLASQVAELPAEMVLGPVAAQIETTLMLERTDHLSRVTEAMDGERYAALVRQTHRMAGGATADQGCAQAGRRDEAVRRAGRA